MRNNFVNYFEWPVVQMSFERLLIRNSGGLPVHWSITIYATLKEGVMGNIYVK